MSKCKTLVLCWALSTASKPFTPTAPPENRLMVSQPGPIGSQLTVGGGGSACGGRGRLCSGMTFRRDGFAVWISGLAAAASFEEEEAEKDSVDGVWTGPVSKAQPREAQPVAAGPTKVGEYSPKLDVALDVAFCAEV